MMNKRFLIIFCGVFVILIISQVCKFINFKREIDDLDNLREEYIKLDKEINNYTMVINQYEYIYDENVNVREQYNTLLERVNDLNNDINYYNEKIDWLKREIDYGK